MEFECLLGYYRIVSTEYKKNRDPTVKFGNAVESARNKAYVVYNAVQGQYQEPIAAQYIINDPTFNGFKEAVTELQTEIRCNVRKSMAELRGGVLDSIDLTGAKLNPTPDGWVQLDDVRSRLWTDIETNIYKTDGRQKKDTEEPRLIPYKIGSFDYDNYIKSIALEYLVDPFLVWLLSLPPWDGIERLDTWLGRLFDIGEMTGDVLGYHASSMILMTVVWRTFHPGYKVDECLLLTIPHQGLGKMSALSGLLPAGYGWYTDEIKVRMNDKKKMEFMQGRVICEFSEAAGLTNFSYYDAFKGWLTQTEDSARLTWRIDPKPAPRRVAFVITSNAERPLPNDPTGNRRFIVVKILGEEAREDPVMFMNEHRVQLWAEALHRYRKGIQPNLPRQLIGRQAVINREYRSRDEGLYAAINASYPEGKQYPGDLLSTIKAACIQNGADMMLKGSVLADELLALGWKKSPKTVVNGKPGNHGYYTHMRNE